MSTIVQQYYSKHVVLLNNRRKGAIKTIELNTRYVKFVIYDRGRTQRVEICLSDAIRLL